MEDGTRVRIKLDIALTRKYYFTEKDPYVTGTVVGTCGVYARTTAVKVKWDIKENPTFTYDVWTYDLDVVLTEYQVDTNRALANRFKI